MRADAAQECEIAADLLLECVSLVECRAAATASSDCGVREVLDEASRLGHELLCCASTTSVSAGRRRRRLPAVFFCIPARCSAIEN